MQLNILTSEQTRQLIDADQAFGVWHSASQEFEHGYEGSYKGQMKWIKRSSGEYLLRLRSNGQSKVIGRRSAETEAIKDAYVKQRNRLRERMRRSKRRLTEMARVNRALRLGRVPKTASAIIDRMDTEGLLGEHLLVVGTHSLYAYEAAAGVHIQSGLMATTDVDLLWESRNKVRLASLDMPPEGILGLIRDIDATFERQRRAFSAVNADGFAVDIIRPMERNEGSTTLRGVGKDGDMEAAAIEGLHWLTNARKFEHTAIDERGMPVRIVCPDPRVFALHKRWLADEAKGRAARKRRRDRAQSLVAAVIAERYLQLPFRAKELSSLPLKMVQHAKGLVADAKAVDVVERE